MKTGQPDREIRKWNLQPLYDEEGQAHVDDLVQRLPLLTKDELLDLRGFLERLDTISVVR